MKASKEIKKFIRDNCDTLQYGELLSLPIPISVARQVMFAAKKNKTKKAKRANKATNRTTTPKKSKRKGKNTEFYKSKEWAEVRYKALKFNDGKCELCGRCKHDGIVLNVDHIKPISKYPKLKKELSNLQILCSSCNWGKSNTDETDWREPSLRVLMGEAI